MERNCDVCLKIEEFETLTIQEQIDYLKTADEMKMPFWMERLKTALEKKAQQCVNIFNKRVKDLYWNLVKEY